MQPEILELRNVYDGYLAIARLRVRLADGAIVAREIVYRRGAETPRNMKASRSSSGRCRSLGATPMQEELPTASSLR
jgi:hypothetical protein